MTTITMDGKYQTRSGGQVRILAIDGTVEQQPVCALFQYRSEWSVGSFGANGSYLLGDTSSDNDLIPVPPPPRMVPLGPEDVPPGSVFRVRHQSAGHWNADVTKTGVILSAMACPTGGFFDWQRLMSECQIKRPGEEWQKCEKPEC